MKNILKLIPLAIITLFFTACGDVDKDPYEINGLDGPFGAFVRLDITTAPVLDVTDIENTSFGGTLSVPSNNVASYEMKVRRVSGGAASDYFPFLSVTSFPAEFTATAASLAAALGLTVPDLLPGDRFDFEATSIGTDGTLVTFDNFSGDLGGNPGEGQSYRFVTYISCPFVIADAIGTYMLTTSEFSSFPTGNLFEVIAGANDNQIIMVNPYGSATTDFNPDYEGANYNVAIDVTPFGIATVESKIDDVNQYIFDTDLTGNGGFFDTYVEGGGFVFSCAGAITLKMDHLLVQISSGSTFIFNADDFAAQKQ